jgi:hypothetical protein
MAFFSQKLLFSIKNSASVFETISKKTVDFKKNGRFCKPV